MAMAAIRRSSRLVDRLLTPEKGAASRMFTNSTALREVSEDEMIEDSGRRSGELRRGNRDSFPGLFSDIFDPFSPNRSLSQVLNVMDQMLESPMVAASRGLGMTGGARRRWDAKEDADALYLRMDMPGLGKEHVKVSLEQNTLVIKGEGEPEDGDADAAPRYSSRVDLPSETYRLDQVKAEMKNGVLRVVVPKLKEAERKDVKQIQID
ncbi:23.6 kDa heat shock protein, mitochondrial-like [Wolffia australiana]